MKRRIATLLIFLLLGAIVNVAVAWACALLPWLGVQMHVSKVSMLTDAQRQEIALEVGTDAEKCRTIRWFGCHRQLFIKSQVKAALLLAGTPMRSLQEVKPASQGGELPTLWEVFPNLPETTVRLSPVWTTGDVRDATLPLGPIWPGFAINTLLYTTILWLLFAAPFALRRWRRIKRGLCPACAYPVGASDVCTECGNPVKTGGIGGGGITRGRRAVE